MGRDVSPDPNLVSSFDVAALAGIKIEVLNHLVRELEKKGEISPVRSKTRQRWFSRSDIEAIRIAWKARHKTSDPGDRGKMHSDAKALSEGLTAMFQSCKAMSERASRLKKLLSVPATSTWKIAALPASGLRLKKNIPVMVIADGHGFTASAADLGLDAFGQTQMEAVRALRTAIARNYFHLRNKQRDPQEEELWSELRRFCEWDAPKSQKKVAGTKPTWRIGTEGRAWEGAEAQQRMSLRPEKLEMFDGKLLASDEERLDLLGLLLENVGANKAVRFGDSQVWLRAVTLLIADASSSS